MQHIAVGQDRGNGLRLELKLSENGVVWFDDLSIWGVGPYANILSIDDNNDLYGMSEGGNWPHGFGYFTLIRDKPPQDPPFAVNPEPNTSVLLLTSLLLSMFLGNRGLRRRWLGTWLGRR